MNQLFRIGGVYRNGLGGPIRLSSIGRGGRLAPEGFAAMLLVECDDWPFLQFARLSDGRAVDDDDLSPVQGGALDITPGELHLFDGQWLQVEEKAEQPMSPYFAEAVVSEIVDEVLNAAMIARDGIAAPKPAVVALPAAPTAHPAINGLTCLADRDHRFGLFRF